MLSPVESDRIYRFARVVALAEDVFEDGVDALEWLKSPQHGLGGCIPFDMLQTDAGSREVEELLNRIDYRGHFVTRAWRLIRKKRLRLMT